MYSLQSEIDTFLQEKLKDSKILLQKEKIIRDAVGGINRFKGWEVNLLDLPILQRLRNIHQNGLTFFTYPTAFQNRFDHTIGMTSIAGKYVEALKLKCDEIQPKDQYNIRIAAIMHDVGHGPFSHASEEYYKNIEYFNDILKNEKFTAGGGDSKPHEVLSYFILNSPVMKEIIDRIPETYSEDFQEELDLKNIGDAIIGKVEDPLKKYYQDIINGSFDADKLDYIQRDAYFSGLKMSIDLERIFFGLEINKKSKDRRNVVINIASVHNLEQLLFNKILLNPSMYHHHKVRAAICMYKSAFEIIRDFNLNLDGLSFNNVVDFLKVDDTFFQNYQSKPDILRNHLENIFNRNLYKRALVISMKTVEGEDTHIKTAYNEFLQWEYDEEKIRDFRQTIAEKVGISEYDIWLDIPHISSLREVSQYSVKIMENTYEEFNKFIPYDDWLSAYQNIQYRSHVFCPPLDSLRKPVARESRKYFEDQLGLKLSPFAEKLAKLDT